jgi:hypothetical protein
VALMEEQSLLFSCCCFLLSLVVYSLVSRSLQAISLFCHCQEVEKHDHGLPGEDEERTVHPKKQFIQTSHSQSR